jgi:hypothetical protein
VNPGTISDQTWDALRAEFTLPAVEQVRARLAEIMDDPEPLMQQLVRVFIGDGTFCPGFQFIDRGQLHPTVTSLFRRAMELRIPHNYFTVWMITPARELHSSRPVDSLHTPQELHQALEGFAAQVPGTRPAK